MPKVKKGSKKETSSKKIKKVSEGRGIIHGFFSFNNTIFRLTKENGDALGKMTSGGTLGFKNTKKGLFSVGELAAQDIIERAKEYGIHTVSLQVKGIGAGRDAAIKKVLDSKDLNVEDLVDKTPEQHGGCRPRKKPRK